MNRPVRRRTVRRLVSDWPAYRREVLAGADPAAPVTLVNVPIEVSVRVA